MLPSFSMVVPQAHSSASLPSALSQIAQVLPGVFSVSGWDQDETNAPVPMVTVRWLSDPEESLPVLRPARVADMGLDRYRLRAGDVLVPSRSTALRVRIAPPSLEGAVFNATLLAVRCGESLLPELLAAYLAHPEGRAQVEAASQSGTAQMNLNASALGAVQIPLPSIDAQRTLAALLRAADDAHRRAAAAADLRRRIVESVVVARLTGRNSAHA